VFTAGQRTWGGPRADAGVADAITNPQQAIEHAEAIGDDLNIVPETFRQASRVPRRKPTMLQPSESIEGRFAPPRRLSGRWDKLTTDCGLPLPPRIARGRAESFSSVESADSIEFTLQTPQFVGSFSGKQQAKGQLNDGEFWSSQVDVEDAMYTDSMPHVSSRTFGLAAPSGGPRLIVSQKLTESRSRQQLRRSRATISASQSRGPDPEELHARLSCLAIPQPTYDRSGAIAQGRSPLGLISPAIYANGELQALKRGGDIEGSACTS
jgi:chitin synthase